MHERGQWRESPVHFLATSGILVRELRGIAGGKGLPGTVDLVLADSGKAMVRGDEDVGVGSKFRIAVDVRQYLRKIAVGILYRRARSGTIDAGR